MHECNLRSFGVGGVLGALYPLFLLSYNDTQLSYVFEKKTHDYMSGATSFWFERFYINWTNRQKGGIIMSRFTLRRLDIVESFSSKFCSFSAVYLFLLLSMECYVPNFFANTSNYVALYFISSWVFITCRASSG